MRNSKISRSEKIVRISLEDEAMKSTIARAYVQLLRKYDCNVSALIRYLNVPRQSFYNKLRMYGINLRELRESY